MRELRGDERGPSDGAMPIIDATALLIGIMSHGSKSAHRRRQAMRAMLQPCSAASVRFVVATNITADDINYADMLLLDVARNDLHLGTFLLTVEFFRFAVALRHLPSFIARADDDAYLQPAAILADLNKFSAATQLVYGFFAEWYSWHPR